MLRTALFAIFAALALPALGQIATSVNPDTLNEHRKTALGLYVTSAEAYAAIRKDPGIVLLDVRTPEEFNFVGHAKAADANVPFNFMDATKLPAKGGNYGWRHNDNFLADVAAVMARLGKGKDDVIFVMCRSGHRSAASVNALAKAGYTQVYNVIDGFEGSKNKATGHRDKEGWRFENLPWTYRIRPDQAYRPAG
ncbi:MAG: sulfurtransferase [Alphaproteobacteria bacterium]|nr:MAG: sulfurtransferase [Alphaproteobacteria bacterium]